MPTPAQKHPENREEVLAMLMARSTALWGKERTEELKSQIENLANTLMQLSAALPEREEDPAFFGW